MPYRIGEKDGKYCVFREGNDEPLGCHPTKEEAEKQLAALYANAGAEAEKMYITVEQMEQLCPDCAARMREQKMKAIDLLSLKALPHVTELCESIGSDPGFFTRCKELDLEGVDDKEALCAWLHHICLGKWPGEKAIGLEERARRVRDAWYAQFQPQANAPMVPPGSFAYPKEVYDAEVIVEMRDGLYSYPYVETETGIQFGEPVKVEISYQVAKALPTIAQDGIAAPGGPLKVLGDGRVGGYSNLFGGKDLVGEHFAADTEYFWEGKETRPALYHHGLDPELNGKTLGNGWHRKYVDQVGLWVETQLNLRDEYEKAIYDLAQKGKLGLSSGTAEHMIQRGDDGKLTRWPIIEISFTPAPAEPRTMVQPIRAITPVALKSLLGTQEGAGGAPTQSGPGAAQGPIKTKSQVGPTRTGGKIMNLMEVIKQLVPGLTDEQYAQLEAVLALAGMTGAAGVGSEESGGGAPGSEEPIRSLVQKALTDLGIQVQPQGQQSPAPALAPARPPYRFEPAPTPATVEPPESPVKAIAALKFGELPAGIKAIVRDLYGDDYEVKRFQQHQAYAHYLRRGNRGLTGEMERALKEIILTPAQIKAMVLSGVSVAEVKTDLAETVDALGGVLVPEDRHLDMLARLPGLTVVRPLADVSSTSSDVMSRVKVTGGDDRHVGPMRVTWVGDTPTAGQAITNPTFGVEKTPVHIAKCTVRVPMALLEDSAYPLEAKVSEWATDEYGIDEDEQFLVGNGIAKPEGILPGGVNTHSLTEVLSGDANTLTADGIIDLVHGIARQYRNFAAFVMADDTVRIVREFKDGHGRYMWEVSLQAGEPDRLLGYPLYTSEAMAAVAINSYPIIFGDFKGYQIADRVGMSVLRDETTLAEEDLVKFLFRRRLGGQVAREWCFAVQKVAAA